MRITSKGVPAHLKPFTRQAIKFFVDNMPDDKPYEFSHIHVEFVSKNIHAEAWCDFDGCYPDDPDEFVIEINKSQLPSRIKPIKYTEILFHELTHAWQFATAKLVIDGPRIAKYGKKKFDLKEFEYFLQPWEVEAYGYQHCLNRLFWDM